MRRFLQEDAVLSEGVLRLALGFQGFARDVVREGKLFVPGHGVQLARMGESIAQLAGVILEHGQQRQHLHIVRVEGVGFGQQLHGFRILLPADVRLGQVEIRGRVLVVGIHGLLEERLALVRVAALHGDHAQIIEGGRIARIYLHGAGEPLLGLLQVLLLKGGDALVKL